MKKITDIIQRDLGMVGSMAAGQVMGALNDQRQQQQTQSNIRMQVKASKEMGEFNQNLAKDMWEYTGYKNQVRQMGEAGLNPALMYGKGGGGGQTAAVAAGNVSAGGAAPSSGGESLAMVQAGLQNQLQGEQINLIRAQTDKTIAEKEKLQGADTENTQADTGLKIGQTGNVKADTVLKQVQTRTENARAKVAEETIDEAIGTIIYEMRRSDEEVSKLVTDNYINRATAEEQIKAVKLENMRTVADVGLKQAQRSNTIQMTEQSKAQVLQWVKENAMKAQQIQNEGRRVTVEELEQGVDRTFKEALIEQGQWHNFINGMNGVINAGTKIPVGTKPGGQIGFPRN